MHLVLFDFSLSRTPADVVHVGTRAYLDPFLDERPSRRWDVHAERWSACVVLHEMATGQRPRWPGGGDPGAMPDVEVELDPAGFPEVIAPRLVAFFERALRRNPRQRFGSMEELRHAWSAVFADLDDTGTDTTTDADSLRERLAAASPGDALASLDLTPRVLDALSRLQAFTVGDLADVSIPELRKARGIGDRTRRQVVALLQLLPTAPTAPAPVEGVQGARGIDELARVLLPADLEPTSTETRVLRALLNLDGAGPAWPSQGDAAAAGGVTRARVSQLVAKARGRWKAIASISQVREDVVATLPSLGGVATTAELADTLLAVRGSSAIDPLERQRRALAALRAAVEAELSLKDKEPRIVERRRGDVVVIADDATGVEGIAAAEWALALGAEADRLVAQDPLPTAGVVLEALRAVELPTGLPAPTDQRLVRLAAACSTGAVASPRLDLHPSAMPPERAVVAARGVLFGPARIGVDAVHERVRARFPGAAPLPQRPELDALMAHIGMRWVPDHDPPGYGPEHEFARLTTIGPSRTRYSSGHPVDTVEQQAVRDVQARLERQAVDGGFCVWSVVPNRFNAAVGDLRQRFGAEPVDADALLLARLRAHAERLGVDWSVVLAADARPGDDEWRNLQVLVDDALADVRAHVLATGPVVVLAGLGLLARYDRLAELEAWRDHASGVRPVADARLATLWVVVPSDDPANRPMAAGRAVPVLGPNQYAAIPNAWIAQPVEAVA